MEADDALAAFARELVSDVIALAVSGNVPAVPKPSPEGMTLPPPPKARKGAGAVHPHLGHHLLTVHHGDTISGHAYTHVPRPLPVAPPEEPDAKDVKLQETTAELERHQEAMDRVREYRHAAGELDRHARDIKSRGQALPGTWKPWTPDEHASHARYAEDSLTRALGSGQATTATETYDGNGQVWKPERAAVHKDIVDGYMRKAEKVPSGHRAILVGGIPAPARSAVGRQAAPERDFLHVNTDDIKEELAARGMVPEVRGLSPMEASPLVHGEAGHVADLVTREALRRGKNVAVHTAMSDPDAIKAHADRFRAAGHTVHGVFVHTPVDKAVGSAASRHRSGHEAWRQQKSNGAKYVTPGLLHAAEAAPGSSVNAGAFEAAKPHLGSWEHWDATGTPRKTAAHVPARAAAIPSPEELLRGE